ncbi:MAG: S8 family serine peptidase [Bdellovibrionales bacterium]|nr:S8 family serine peptidase [Bdellovibrionales bacterium]
MRKTGYNNNRKKVLFLYLLLMPVLFFYQNCGQQKALVEEYDSPFTYDRVLVSEEIFEKSFEEGDEQIELDIIIDNACALEQCDEDSEAVSCELVNEKMDERLSSTQQHYSFMLDLDESFEISELEDYFFDDSVDESCVVGVTNVHEYKTDSFNDSYYASHQKAYLDDINFQQSTSSFKAEDLERVRVGVIDSGIGTSSDLPNVVLREDMRTATQKAKSCPSVYSNENPQHFHGSFVAGIIAAKSNNNTGMTGLAPNVDLYSYTAADCNGSLNNIAISNSILKAIAVDGVEVLNMSIGGSMPDDFGLRSAIVQAMNKNVIVVTSAGNSGLEIGPDHHSYYPAMYAADYPGVISVGALEDSSTKASFSNYSSGDSVTITAPGVNIVSTDGGAHRRSILQLDGEYSKGDGTSYSAPMVTAAIALTLGRLKKLKYSYDLLFIKDLVVNLGARKVTMFQSEVKYGAVLDLQKLAGVLATLQSGGSNESITAQPRIVEENGKTYIEIDADWDLTAAHHGARLGLFDTSGACNYTEPCILQDFDLTSLQGDKVFRLSLNEVAPMVPDLRDPNFSLNLSIAVYYRIPNKIDEETGEIINYKNNFGINASKSVDVRTLDNSDDSSQLKGEITNYRKDMQNLYISGWACFEGNNQAVTVSLKNYDTNATVQTNYSYVYPYMVPHGSPIDGSPYWPIGGGDYDLSTRDEKPYIADGIDIAFGKANSFKAGLEASPIIIEGCDTLTAAHGFEFILPLEDVANLNQAKVKVIASFGGASLTLDTENGKDHMVLPEIIDNEAGMDSLNIARGNDHFNIEGDLCSESPAPVEVEVSFTYEDFRIALFGSTSPDLEADFRNGFVHVYQYRNVKDNIYEFGESHDKMRAQIKRGHHSSQWGDLFAEAYDSYTEFQPNAYFIRHSNSDYVNSVNTSYDLRQIGTGEAINFYHQNEALIDVGSMVTMNVEASKEYQKAAATAPYSDSLSKYWDYYDVGQSFSSSLVGYAINTESEIGQSIEDEYGVKTILREIKKFETPLKKAAHILKNDHLEIDGRCGAGYNHNFSSQVNNYINYNPELRKYIQGYWLDSEQQPTEKQRDALQAAMKKVPLTLRFFQDGKMVKHIVTDFGDSFEEVGYPF